MSAPLTRFNLAKARLLLVDDDEQSLEVLSAVLLGLGVRHARKCESAAEARRAISQSPYDLMLVDHVMPVEDGLSLCREVRRDLSSQNRTTPLILLTSRPSRETVALARDAGAHFTVAKPVSPAILLQRIEWLARSGRNFISSDGYCGPDRRFQKLPLPPGIEERRYETLRLLEEPERALSQDDIDSLFP